MTDEPPMISFEALFCKRAGTDLAYLKSLLADRNIDALWIEVTTPDVAELGFRVVRTVIPGCNRSMMTIDAGT